MGRTFFLTLAAVLVWSGTAGAAQIVQPASQPFAVPSDKNGNPVAFTVTATGFKPNQPVSISQCDGTPPTAPQWQATANCDIGSSPAPVKADANGTATFDKNDPNHAFVAFVGRSPQDIFSCPPPGTCTIRVASNVSSTTEDQVFLAIRLPTPHGPPVATPSNAAHSGASPSASGANNATASDPSAATAAAGASGANAGAPTTGSHGPSSLALTGITTLLAGIGFVLLGLGIAVLSRHAGRRAPT